jgi:hypothetical protein
VILMGLDLSATAAAAYVVSLSWDGDFRRVKTLVGVTACAATRATRSGPGAVRALRSSWWRSLGCTA